jgi:hypothetical protein
MSENNTSEVKMEPLSAGDRPSYLNTTKKKPWGWLLAVLLVLLVGAGGYYYYTQMATPAPAPQAAAEKTPPAKAETPAPPKFELKPSTEEPLPSLENSDSMIGQLIAGLLGQKAFDQFVISDGLVRRIVATVDSLPRASVPKRVMPVRPVHGAFAVAGPADNLRISASNAARYAPFVRVFTSLDAHAAVQSYVRAYPLFQAAYEQLGYPGKYFNDRLIEAIDDLLEAPDPDAPIKITPAPVIYKFSDPDLEELSAGQKIMIRMGKNNALAVKAKLQELRRELVAAAVVHQ